MEVLDNAKVLDNEPENSTDSNSNVRMSLDCKNDLLEVAIKLNDEVSFEDLALLIVFQFEISTLCATSFG
ncbi:hypothetical protein TYRP_007157 [Tyrophagus putrescentiae]|nr:hypothetical protein TYRP_007157 [Tyrophagus putrescentiae]